MSTKYWMAALLIVALAAPALFPGGIQTAQANKLDDETGQFMEKVGRPPSSEEEDTNGWTDLHYAAALNFTSLAKHLLESDVKVNAKLRLDGEPFTEKLKETLRRFGKDYDDWKRDGQTPLHIAAKENAHETAALLLDNGAKVNAETFDKEWTPLHFAAKENARKTTVLLLEKGAEVNAETDGDDDEMTPLHFAARENAHAVAQLLLDKGADVNASDDDDRTPLHQAAWHDARSVAELLLDKGADVNVRDEDGWTPLHIAARRDALNVTKLLLDRGADVNARDEDGDTPLDFSADETEALLRSYGGYSGR